MLNKKFKNIYFVPTISTDWFFFILDNSIKSRFYQPGFAKYRKVESLLLKSIKGEDFTEEFEFVSSFYKDDISSTPLKIQLETLATQISEKNPSLLDLIKIMKHLTLSPS